MSTICGYTKSPDTQFTIQRICYPLSNVSSRSLMQVLPATPSLLPGVAFSQIAMPNNAKQALKEPKKFSSTPHQHRHSTSTVLLQPSQLYASQHYLHALHRAPASSEIQEFCCSHKARLDRLIMSLTATSSHCKKCY